MISARFARLLGSNKTRRTQSLLLLFYYLKILFWASGHKFGTDVDDLLGNNGQQFSQSAITLRRERTRSRAFFHQCRMLLHFSPVPYKKKEEGGERERKRSKKKNTQGISTAQFDTSAVTLNFERGITWT